MSAIQLPIDRPSADQLAALRAQVAQAQGERGPALAFGLAGLDDRLADHGLDGAGLHEIAAASSTLSDDAATTLFAAGIAARFAAQSSAPTRGSSPPELSAQEVRLTAADMLEVETSLSGFLVHGDRIGEAYLSQIASPDRLYGMTSI